MDPNVDLAAGSKVAERYEVVRLLGEGGMGAVYEVVDSATKRRRALKVMLPSVVKNQELRQRFEREAVVVAEVRSDHIAEVFDAGVDDARGVPFIVLELLEGSELAELVEARGALPASEVATYLDQAALALDKAHEAKVVHRDLKPENLFVTYADDGRPRVKVLDFGIAKVLAETVAGPETQGIVGTPLYMAPEQMRGKKLGPPADVYALGQVAYQSLSGEAYFRPEQEDSESIYGLLMQLVEGPQEPASVRARRRRGVSLPEGFDAWFDIATARVPSRRFATAGELAAAFRSAVGASPASPTTTPGSPLASPPQPASAVTAPAAPARTIVGTPAEASAATATSSRLADATTSGSSQSAIAAATPVPTPNAAPSSGVRWLAVGVAVLSVGGAGIWWVMRAGGEPVADRDGPSPPPAVSLEPSEVDAAPAAGPPEPHLRGRWISGSKRVYDVRWTGEAYAFRIVDPTQFQRQGYAELEPRFELVPDGDGYTVRDHVRPRPPGSMRYDPGAHDSCLRTITSVGGEPLRAELDDEGKLTVNMVAFTPTVTMFVHEGSKVVRCQDLDRGVTRPQQSKVEPAPE